MRINAAGNVGIGTAPTQGTLHVYGESGLTYQRPGRFAYFNLIDQNGVATIGNDGYALYVGGTGNGGSIYFRSQANYGITATMNTSGLVGIGTTVMTANVDVFGATTTPTSIRTRNGSGVIAAMSVDSGAAYTGSISSHPYVFTTTNTERMRLTTAGFLGIGVSNPQSMLDVVGGVAVGNYAGNQAAGSNNIIVSGQVGIGTSLPGQNLAVVGTTLLAGNLQVNGNIVSTASGQIGNIAITNTTAATSSTTGALTVGGGVGVAGNAFVGGNIVVTNATGISTFAGNVGVGTTVATAGYLLSVNGGLAATIKSFVINHPTKPGKKLQYASLEGPENGVYVRGRLSNNNTIRLPDYWSALVDVGSMTVSLTPIGRYQKLYVENISPDTITVAADGWFKSNIDCYYTVYAERRDVEKLRVEV